MDPCMQFRSNNGLEKTLTFKISIKRIFYILFCDRVPLNVMYVVNAIVTTQISKLLLMFQQKSRSYTISLS